MKRISPSTVYGRACVLDIAILMSCTLRVAQHASPDRRASSAPVGENTTRNGQRYIREPVSVC